MKKFFSFAVTAMAILGLGSLTSCHDEDLGVSTAVLQERAFEQGFIKEFGQPSADQSWDFYAQKMESLNGDVDMTRATQAITEDSLVSINQPLNKDYFVNIVKNIKYSLEDNHNNSAVGQNAYSLTSTGNFNIYAVLYEGYYEHTTGNNFEFGMVYNGTEIPLFKPITYYQYHKLTRNNQGAVTGRTTCRQGEAINPGCDTLYSNTNGVTIQPKPGFGYTVKSAPGDKFHFYMKLSVNNTNEQYRGNFTYDSNSSTFYLQAYNASSNPTGNYDLVDRYDNNPAGPSVLVYSMEVNAQAEGNKQIMILGFEDGWAGSADADYNDIVILLEGNLPEPTSKRFFCEDKESFDWDYNDVVFDVSNYGITLRAVGGTLPVFLRVKEKGSNTKRIIGLESKEDKKIYYELHELMRSQQYQSDYIDDHGNLIEALHKNAQLTYTLNGKTYYRPIDVGIKPQGYWLDPVLIADWVGKPARLTDTEVERFANPLSDNMVGDIELIVLPQSQYSSTGYDVDELLNLPAFSGPGDDPDAPKIIPMSQVGKVPAIWSAPVSVQWMKELTKITLGYKNFYGAGDADNVYGYQWWENNVDLSKTYDYTGDGDDTYTP